MQNWFRGASRRTVEESNRKIAFSGFREIIPLYSPPQSLRILFYGWWAHSWSFFLAKDFLQIFVNYILLLIIPRIFLSLKTRGRVDVNILLFKHSVV